jgi:hypothetical protein
VVVDEAPRMALRDWFELHGMNSRCLKGKNSYNSKIREWGGEKGSFLRRQRSVIITYDWPLLESLGTPKIFLSQWGASSIKRERQMATKGRDFRRTRGELLEDVLHKFDPTGP